MNTKRFVKRSARRFDAKTAQLEDKHLILISYLAIFSPYFGVHSAQNFAVKEPIRTIRYRLGIRLPPNLDPMARWVKGDLLGYERIVEGHEMQSGIWWRC